MCWDFIKKDRHWALFLSGAFFAVFLITLIFYLLDIEMAVFGITITRPLMIIRMAVTLVLAYLFLKYAEKGHKRK